MNNPSSLGGKREGSMVGRQAHGSVLVHGFNDFFPCLELMMYILHPHITRSVKGVV